MNTTWSRWTHCTRRQWVCVLWTGAEGACAGSSGGDGVGARDGVREGGHVRDVVGLGVLGADGGDAGVAGFAGFGERVVAGVEVLTFLEIIGLARRYYRHGDVEGLSRHIPSACFAGCLFCLAAYHRV